MRCSADCSASVPGGGAVASVSAAFVRTPLTVFATFAQDCPRNRVEVKLQSNLSANSMKPNFPSSLSPLSPILRLCVCHLSSLVISLPVAALAEVADAARAPSPPPLLSGDPPSPAVVIPDPALESVIWQTLGRQLPVGTITKDDMLRLTSLQAAFVGVRSLAGLGAAHNLTVLGLEYNSLSHLELPPGLYHLRTLNLGENGISKLTLPPGLTNLANLVLQVHYSGSFTIEGDGSYLDVIDLSWGFLSELHLPNDLHRLRFLNFNHNAMYTPSLPTGLRNLRGLDLSYNSLTNLDLPADLTTLAHLDASYNSLADLTLPERFTQLTTLALVANQLTNVVVPGGLSSLETVDLSRNELTQFTLPEGLIHLKELRLSNNRLTSFTLPSGLRSLTWLDLSENPLTSVTFPGDLTQLRWIFLPDVSGLVVTLPRWLAERNLARWVAEVQARGVVVRYSADPVNFSPGHWTAEGLFEFDLSGTPGTYQIQVTDDLQVWEELTSVVNTNGLVRVSDTRAKSRSRAFYRAVQVNEAVSPATRSPR